MPVVLDDSILIPPSMRRRQYVERDRVFEISSNASSSTIELPSHHVEYQRPLSPLVIHQERIVPAEVEIVRDREYIIEPAGGRRRYRSSGEFIVERRGRARSTGYDSDSYCSTCDETETIYIDGSMGRRRRRRRAELGALAAGGALAAHEGERHGSPRRLVRHDHAGRHIAEAGAVALGARELSRHRRRRSTEASPSDAGSRRSHHPVRHVAEAGLGAVGAHKLYEGYREHHVHERERHPGWYDENHDSHRRALHLAEAGLGIAAAGAAKEMYDAHRRRACSRASQRSRSSSTSSNEGRFGRHPGRHVAAAALGATAAGLAAHKHFEHRRRSQSRGSHSSYSSDDEGHKSHRGRKLAAAAAGATAVGLAAKAIHDHRAHSRSRSSSASGSDRGHHHHHKHRNAVLGLGAAGPAAHRARSHSRPGILRHRRSSSASSTPSSHKARNAALGLGAAGLAAHRARSHSRPGILRRRRRSSSTSSTSSTSSAASSSHKLRNTALLGGAALAAHELHKKHKQRERERSPSRPGILRRRSRTHSPPRQRDHSRVGQLAAVTAATMAGALAERHHLRKQERRSRSADGGSPHRRLTNDERRHQKHRHHHHHREEDSESSPATRPRRRSGIGNMIRNVVSPQSPRETGQGVGIRDHAPYPRSGSAGAGYRNVVAQEVAYRIGEGVAEGIRRANTTTHERQ